MDLSVTNSRAGFGFMHDGRVDTLARFMVDGFTNSPNTATDQAIANMVALMLCWSGSDLNTSAPSFRKSLSLDVPASAGRQFTFTEIQPSVLLSNMVHLALQPFSRLELVIRGKRNGIARQWLLRRADKLFQPDRNGDDPMSLMEVISGASSDNPYTATLVPIGTGERFGLDRDLDGVYDATEIEAGTDPANAASFPAVLRIALGNSGSRVTLTWNSAPGMQYDIEWATNWPITTGVNVWKILATQPASASNQTTFSEVPPAGQAQRFYRVRLNP